MLMIKSTEYQILDYLILDQRFTLSEFDVGYSAFGVY